MASVDLHSMKVTLPSKKRAAALEEVASPGRKKRLNGGKAKAAEAERGEREFDYSAFAKPPSASSDAGAGAGAGVSAFEEEEDALAGLTVGGAAIGADGAITSSAELTFNITASRYAAVSVVVERQFLQDVVRCLGVVDPKCVKDSLSRWKVTVDRACPCDNGYFTGTLEHFVMQEGDMTGTQTIAEAQVWVADPKETFFVFHILMSEASNILKSCTQELVEICINRASEDSFAFTNKVVFRSTSMNNTASSSISVRLMDVPEDILNQGADGEPVMDHRSKYFECNLHLDEYDKAELRLRNGAAIVSSISSNKTNGVPADVTLTLYSYKGHTIQMYSTEGTTADNVYTLVTKGAAGGRAAATEAPDAAAASRPFDSSGQRIDLIHEAQRDPKARVFSATLPSKTMAAMLSSHNTVTLYLSGPLPQYDEEGNVVDYFNPPLVAEGRSIILGKEGGGGEAGEADEAAGKKKNKMIVSYMFTSLRGPIDGVGEEGEYLPPEDF